MKKFDTKSNLDEMQEAKLLKIEHNGCWLAFWGLLAAIIVQLFITPAEEVYRTIAGEQIVFVVLAIYIGAGCMKNGIWDRRLKADPKTNVILSLIAGVVSGLIMAVRAYIRSGAPVGSIATFVFSSGMIFGLCFLGLSLSARQYRKRLSKLESECDEEEKEEEKA